MECFKDLRTFGLNEADFTFVSTFHYPASRSVLMSNRARRFIADSAGLGPDLALNRRTEAREQCLRP